LATLLHRVASPWITPLNVAEGGKKTSQVIAIVEVSLLSEKAAEDNVRANVGAAIWKKWAKDIGGKVEK
jgi:hypothetical protein